MSKRMFAILIACLFVAVVAAVAAEPIIGTWRMNPAKSTVVGTDKMQSHVVTYSEEPGGMVKMAANLVDPKGNKIQRSWVSKRDGKQGPMTSEIADTISIVLSPDKYSSTWVTKKAGKVATEGKSVISKDGKTMTWTWKGTSPEGKPTSGKTVFDRQ